MICTYDLSCIVTLADQGQNIQYRNFCSSHLVRGLIQSVIHTGYEMSLIIGAIEAWRCCAFAQAVETKSHFTDQLTTANRHRKRPFGTCYISWGLGFRLNERPISFVVIRNHDFTGTFLFLLQAWLYETANAKTIKEVAHALLDLEDGVRILNDRRTQSLKCQL
jgi:hypothetical protein